MADAFRWDHAQGLEAIQYVCGFCGSFVSSEKGWNGVSTQRSGGHSEIRLCPKCTLPTFFDGDGGQSPGPIPGSPVKNIDDASVEQLYEEARQAIGVNSFTGAVLCCRKLLMHIAVAKGAKEGKSFVSYVEYLANNHFVPPDAKGWVDHIRTRGNEANHEIVISTREDAEELLSFSEMLLRVIFEFPGRVKQRSANKTSP